MVSELKGPTHSQIKQFIVDKSIINFKISNDEIITGRILWTDELALFLEKEDNSRVTIFLNAILYFYK